MSVLPTVGVSGTIDCVPGTESINSFFKSLTWIRRDIDFLFYVRNGIGDVVRVVFKKSQDLWGFRLLFLRNPDGNFEDFNSRFVIRFFDSGYNLVCENYVNMSDGDGISDPVYSILSSYIPGTQYNDFNGIPLLQNIYCVEVCRVAGGDEFDDVPVSCHCCDLFLTDSICQTDIKPTPAKCNIYCDHPYSNPVYDGQMDFRAGTDSEVFPCGSRGPSWNSAGYAVPGILEPSYVNYKRTLNEQIDLFGVSVKDRMNLCNEPSIYLDLNPAHSQGVSTGSSFDFPDDDFLWFYFDPDPVSGRHFDIMKCNILCLNTPKYVVGRVDFYSEDSSLDKTYWFSRINSAILLPRDEKDFWYNGFGDANSDGVVYPLARLVKSCRLKVVFCEKALVQHQAWAIKKVQFIGSFGCPLEDVINPLDLCTNYGSTLSTWNESFVNKFYSEFELNVYKTEYSVPVGLRLLDSADIQDLTWDVSSVSGGPFSDNIMVPLKKYNEKNAYGSNTFPNYRFYEVDPNGFSLLSVDDIVSITKVSGPGVSIDTVKLFDGNAEAIYGSVYSIKLNRPVDIYWLSFYAQGEVDLVKVKFLSNGSIVMNSDCPVGSRGFFNFYSSYHPGCTKLNLNCTFDVSGNFINGFVDTVSDDSGLALGRRVDEVILDASLLPQWGPYITDNRAPNQWVNYSYPYSDFTRFSFYEVNPPNFKVLGPSDVVSYSWVSGVVHPNSTMYGPVGSVFDTSYKLIFGSVYKLTFTRPIDIYRFSMFTQALMQGRFLLKFYDETDVIQRSVSYDVGTGSNQIWTLYSDFHPGCDRLNLNAAGQADGTWIDGYVNKPHDATSDPMSRRTKYIIFDFSAVTQYDGIWGVGQQVGGAFMSAIKVNYTEQSLYVDTPPAPLPGGSFMTALGLMYMESCPLPMADWQVVRHGKCTLRLKNPLDFYQVHDMFCGVSNGYQYQLNFYNNWDDNNSVGLLQPFAKNNGLGKRNLYDWISYVPKADVVETNRLDSKPLYRNIQKVVFNFLNYGYTDISWFHMWAMVMNSSCPQPPIDGVKCPTCSGGPYSCNVDGLTVFETDSLGDTMVEMTKFSIPTNLLRFNQDFVFGVNYVGVGDQVVDYFNVFQRLNGLCTGHTYTVWLNALYDMYWFQFSVKFEGSHNFLEKIVVQFLNGEDVVKLSVNLGTPVEVFGKYIKWSIGSGYVIKGDMTKNPWVRGIQKMKFIFPDSACNIFWQRLACWGLLTNQVCVDSVPAHNPFPYPDPNPTDPGVPIPPDLDPIPGKPTTTAPVYTVTANSGVLSAMVQFCTSYTEKFSAQGLIDCRSNWGGNQWFYNDENGVQDTRRLWDLLGVYSPIRDGSHGPFSGNMNRCYMVNHQYWCSKGKGNLLCSADVLFPDRINDGFKWWGPDNMCFLPSTSSFLEMNLPYPADVFSVGVAYIPCELFTTTPVNTTFPNSVEYEAFFVKCYAGDVLIADYWVSPNPGYSFSAGCNSPSLHPPFAYVVPQYQFTDHSFSSSMLSGVTRVRVVGRARHIMSVQLIGWFP